MISPSQILEERPTEVLEADVVLAAYPLPNSLVDNGNLYFAGTEYQKYAEKLREALASALEVIDVAREALSMAKDIAEHEHSDDERNWTSMCISCEHERIFTEATAKIDKLMGGRDE
jgi:hypothetical protein